MDDQSSTPMSDFLFSLQRKPTDTTVQEPPVAASSEAPVAAEANVAAPAATEWPSPAVAPGMEAQASSAQADVTGAAPAASGDVASLVGDGGQSPAGTVPEAVSEAVTESVSADVLTDPKTIHANKVRVITKALRAMESNIANIIRLLEEDAPVGTLSNYTATVESVDPSMVREAELNGIRQVDGRVIEGVFDGQSMVGSDGKIYTVPPNYASKSKLVEGDLLKLTITSKGSFIYKQIGPIERARVVATLGFDATNGEFYATQDNRRWTIIKASVTYFKGEPEDEVILLVPKNAPSRWAAVENIIKQTLVI